MCKGLKKVFSVILAFVLVFSVIPMSAIVDFDTLNIKAEAAEFSVGDVIEFGSYPKNEVTDEGVLSRLFGLQPNKYGDVWLNGTKYRRKSYKGETKFFEYSPIRWFVLSVDSSTMYVMSEYVLDTQEYGVSHSEYWPESTLRYYLNNDFYNSAFTISQKNSIVLSDVCSSNALITWESTDYVFAAPAGDLLEPSYGFSSDEGSASSRVAYATEYAKFSDLDVSGNSATWWSSDCYGLGLVFRVWTDGALGVNSQGSASGVRPAMRLKMNSNIVKAYSQYTIRVMDETTGKPLYGAKVTVNGNEYTTPSHGIVTFRSSSITSGRLATVSKVGYTTNSISLSQVLMGNNTIYLSPSYAKDPFDVVGDIESIDLGSATANGPTINVLGKEMTLFSAELGLKLDLADFNCVGKYDKSNNTYKIILGVKDGVTAEGTSQDQFLENYEDFKDFFNLTNQNKTYLARQKYQKIQNKLDKKPGVVAVNGDVAVAGFMNFDVSGGKLKLIESGVTVTVAADYSADFPIWYVFYATYTIGGEAEGTFSFKASNTGDFICAGSFGLAFKPSVGVGVKAISKKIASCEVGLKGELGAKISFPAYSLAEALSANLNINAYIKANLFALYYNKSTDWDGFSFFPRSSAKAIYKAGLTEPDLTLTADDFTLVDRSYLDKRVKARTYRMTNSIDLYKNAVYPFGTPQIVNLNDGRMISLWVDDDGTKSNANLTTLYYSFFNGTSWSTETPVCESGYAEFTADIVSDGENVYAIWQRATKSFTDDVTVDDYAQNTELVFSVFDGETWSAPVVITNNMAIDYSIDITDGILTTVWSENSENDYLCESGSCSVKKAVLTDGNWVETTVASEFADIESLAVGSLNGEVKVLYCVDGVIYVDDVALTTATNNCAVSYQNGSFWWVSDGKLVGYNGTIQEHDIYASSDYKVISNGNKTAFLSTIVNGFSNELYIAFLEDGTFGELKQFTNYGAHISDYDSVMYSDGTIVLAADIDNMSTDEESDLPFTTTDFIIEGVKGTYNLAIDEIPVVKGDIVTGNTVAFEFNITNKGSNSVDSYKLKLVDGADNVLFTKDVTEHISSGEVVSSRIEYTLPSVITRTEYNIVVELYDDIDINDNISTYEIGFADLVFEKAFVSEDGVVTGVLKNIGYENAENVNVTLKKFNDSQNQIDLFTVGTIASGESVSVSFTVPESEIKFDALNTKFLFNIDATTSSDEINITNNGEEVALFATAVTGVELDVNEKTVLVGDEFPLEATIKPLGAINKNVIWTTSNSAVAIVDEDGVVSAIGAGVATIRATTEDGAFIADCIVTVHEYDAEFTIDVDPTCVTEGSKSKHCLGCDLVTDITVIPATGHNYEITDVLSGHPHTTTHTCLNCGEEKNEAPTVSDCIECIYGEDTPIKETEKTEIDFGNLLIFTCVENSSAVTEILEVSENASAIPTANHIFGNYELLGTGTIFSVFDGNTHIGDFTLIVEGDLNGDSVCDVLDASTAQLYSAGFDEASEIEILASNGCISDELDASSYQNVVNLCLAS